MGTPNQENQRPNSAQQRLDALNVGPDKNKAREWLEGKVSIEQSKEHTLIQMDGKTLSLPPSNPKMQALLQSLIETLIVEKSVCEARLNLLAECQGKIGTKGGVLLGGGPDIYFSTSILKVDDPVMRYEVLGRIFQDKNQLPIGIDATRSIGEKIVHFINGFPENYIPRQIIEIGPHAPRNSATK